MKPFRKIKHFLCNVTFDIFVNAYVIVALRALEKNIYIYCMFYTVNLLYAVHTLQYIISLVAVSWPHSFVSMNRDNSVHIQVNALYDAGRYYLEYRTLNM